MKATVWTQKMEEEFQKLKTKLFQPKEGNIFDDLNEISTDRIRYNELLEHRNAHKEKIDNKGGDNTNLFSDLDLN